MTAAQPASSRRLVFIVLAALALGACVPEMPPLRVDKPAGAADADKVTRLLIWLPQGSAMFDAANVAKSLKAKLSASGVAVDVGTSQPLELDRGDAQRARVVAFRPSHRLDLDLASATGTGAGVSLVTVTGKLYAGTGKTPIRTLFFMTRGKVGGTPSAADRIADDLIQKLQLSGIAFG